MALLQRNFANEIWAINQVKPTGFMNINWGHPLTQNLEGYWFDTGLGVIVDLVNPSRTMGMQGTAPPIGTTPFGTGFKWNGSPSAFFPSDARIQSVTANGPYSVVGGFMPTQSSPSTNAMPMGRTANNSGPSTTTPNWAFFYSGSLWRFINLGSSATGAAGNTLTGALAANTYVGMCGTLPPTGTGTGFLYTQGFQDDVIPNGLGSTNTNDDIIFGGASAAAASAAYTGYAFWMGFWSRQLTAAENQQLFEQPYIFLRGTPRMRARFVTAGGGTHHGLPIIGAG